MKEKKYSAIIILAGLFTMFYVQYYLRPHYAPHNLLKIVMGCLPNLISAIILPYAGFWLLNRWLNFYSLLTQDIIHITTCLFLISYEMLQLIPVLGKTFDYFDITATIAGTIISSLCMKELIKSPVIITVESAI